MTSYLNVLDDPEENQRMVKKLPSYIVNRWSRKVDERISRTTGDHVEDSFCTSPGEGGYPTFSEFCHFVKTEARISCSPLNLNLKTEENGNKYRPNKPTRFGPKFSSFATGLSVETPTHENSTFAHKQQRCLYCKEERHEINDCGKFLELTISDKRSFIVSKHLCWGCLKWAHINNKCRRKRSCKICNETHPTALHGDTHVPKEAHKPETVTANDGNKPRRQADASASSNCIKIESNTPSDQPLSHSLIVPVWLHHEINPHNKVLVYALLDEQSDACFVKESVLNELQVSGPDVELELSTVLAKKVITSRRVDGLVVRGVNEMQDITLPKTYTREVIPAERNHIPRPETARKWPHLESIAESIMPLREDIEVAILIGTNCTRAIKPREIIPGKDDDPYGKKTALGWGIVGVVDYNGSDDKGNRVGHCTFVTNTQVKEVFNHVQMKKMFEIDFSENEKMQALSHDYRLFLKKVEEGIHQLPSGHYELPLPLKRDDLILPNNKQQAANRLHQLRRRFKRDTKYKEDYINL